MALHKAIKYGKEKRKEYIGKNFCKSVDTHCQNHGGRYHSWQCQWCLDNRTKKNREKEKITKNEIKAHLQQRD